MTDISDKELRTEIGNILKDADLRTTSTKKVIKKLEEIFKTSLTSKKGVIDTMVMNYINSQSEEEEEDEDEEEEDEDDEESRKPLKRSAKSVRKSKRSKNNAGAIDEDEDDVVDDTKDTEYEAKAPKPKKAATKSTKAGGKGGGRGKGGGYTRAYKLSPALADIMGAEEMPRHEVVKRMWAVIKEKKLHDPNNKQFAICDEALYKVIGTKRFRIFGMMKYLKSHFIDE